MFLLEVTFQPMEAKCRSESVQLGSIMFPYSSTCWVNRMAFLNCWQYDGLFDRSDSSTACCIFSIALSISIIAYQIKIFIKLPSSWTIYTRHISFFDSFTPPYGSNIRTLNRSSRWDESFCTIFTFIYFTVSLWANYRVPLTYKKSYPAFAAAEFY